MALGYDREVLLHDIEDDDIDDDEDLWRKGEVCLRRSMPKAKYAFVS